MITAIDTNVLVALWAGDDALNSMARTMLDSALARGRLVISGVVFAELIAYPGRTDGFVNQFVTDTAISVEWALNEAIWRAAGTAFQKYVKTRRKHRASEPRRLLADFVIGAHAAINGYRLLTFDQRIYKAAFPELVLLTH